MTALFDGKLRDEYLANRAVPHMSQSQFWTPIPRLRGAILGSDACLMTASQIMLHRAIVLREGQFLRAHTFVV